MQLTVRVDITCGCVLTSRVCVYRYAELKQQLELKQSEAQLREEKLKQSTHGQQLDEIQQLQQSIGTYSSWTKYSSPSVRAAASV